MICEQKSTISKYKINKLNYRISYPLPEVRPKDLISQEVNQKRKGHKVVLISLFLSNVLEFHKLIKLYGIKVYDFIIH